jgi:hypothetical protein
MTIPLQRICLSTMARLMSPLRIVIQNVRKKIRTMTNHGRAADVRVVEAVVVVGVVAKSVNRLM